MPVPRLPYELNPYPASFSRRVTNCQSECPFALSIVLSRDKCYRARSCSTPPRPPHKKGVGVGTTEGAQRRQKALNSGWTFTLAPGVRIPSHPLFPCCSAHNHAPNGMTPDDADNTDDQRKVKSWSCTIRDDPHCNRANSSRRAKLSRARPILSPRKRNHYLCLSESSTSDLKFSAQVTPFHRLQFLAHFYDVCARNDTADIYRGINDAIAPDDGAGIYYRIATDLGPIANDRAKFCQSGRNYAILDSHRNFAVIEFHIR